MTRLEEIVDAYCCDTFYSGCHSDCEYCKNRLRSELEELVKETREKVIEEFVSKYKAWSKEPCTSDAKVNGEICQGICIDCFVKETGLLKEKKE